MHYPPTSAINALALASVVLFGMSLASVSGNLTRRARTEAKRAASASSPEAKVIPFDIPAEHRAEPANADETERSFDAMERFWGW